ncbi:hypothetical protein RFI36_04590 [Acinetobacter gerneri]|uniref:Uncharacterized protein n=1 Tax=Acinetobacter gerneri TaxID=202952 RepID=A0AAW8JE95_9GAMM|nr:hypothetical protein [Acinetobacter gerneri]MDQ9009052.1 hypothetical protein [Acinetobacter gerneri]MDQ9013156.1 hypothetical protein [Acinetobacter gerneri]MDQ9024593.1 hypothetical protein [Acinetobacter gerneri]MDQ9051828.1 hypothetical protein [Acinetobacter gerneri]MDQ9059191.1 hypothetical protein [Acinetobacter gerneri]
MPQDFKIDSLEQDLTGGAIRNNEHFSDGKDELSDELLEQRLKVEQQDLKAASLQKQHTRDENWKEHFAKAFVVAFWVLWFLFIVMCISLILHWILPSKFHWLSVEQLDKIKTIIIAALASKAISNKVEKA